MDIIKWVVMTIAIGAMIVGVLGVVGPGLTTATSAVSSMDATYGDAGYTSPNTDRSGALDFLSAVLVTTARGAAGGSSAGGVAILEHFGSFFQDVALVTLGVLAFIFARHIFS